LINWRANSHEKNKSLIDFKTAQKTTYWWQNWNRILLRLKIAQRTTLFQRSTAFLIKSLSVLSFLDVQNNKLRSVITILSEITWLLWYMKYKAIVSSIFYQKSNLDSCRLDLYHSHLTKVDNRRWFIADFKIEIEKSLH